MAEIKNFQYITFMNSSKGIYSYSDYRLFLKDYYDFHKKLIRGFTLAILAELAGFSSPSFIKHLIDGKRNLTKESVVKMSRALRFSKPAAAYFESLVFFNQSITLEDKLHFLHQMDQFRPKNQPHVLSSEDYKYLEKWYHPAIRELVDLPGFQESPDTIAKSFIVALKPDEVAKALVFLEDNGFLTRTSNNTLARTHKTIGVYNSSHEVVINTAIRQFHKAMLKIAEKAISTQPLTVRSVGNTTLSFSEKAYEIAVQRINNLRLELLEIAKTDTASNRVYQFTTVLFPLTTVPYSQCFRERE